MKQIKQQPAINLETFQEVSLFQMIPSGTGMSLSLLKTIVDSVHNGRAQLNSLLITGKEALQTHSSAFLRAIGIDNYNKIDASLLQGVFDLHVFLSGEEYDGYVILNVEEISTDAQKHLYTVLTKKQLKPYNYLEKQHDIFDVPGLIIMTSKNIKKVAGPILKAVDHIVEIEKYTTEQRELIILQRLKYAHIDYENEWVLKNIIGHGNNDLNKSIRFMRLYRFN